jgi:hypothetical protein
LKDFRAGRSCRLKRSASAVILPLWPPYQISPFYKVFSLSVFIESHVSFVHIHWVPGYHRIDHRGRFFEKLKDDNQLNSIALYRSNFDADGLTQKVSDV